MSPVTLVVGKAHLRMNLSVGTAPKIVPNIAVLKKDMKMDEDLTGLFSPVEPLFLHARNSKCYISVVRYCRHI